VGDVGYVGQKIKKGIQKFFKSGGFFRKSVFEGIFFEPPFMRLKKANSPESSKNQAAWFEI
jgi:hypothetical protein